MVLGKSIDTTSAEKRVLIISKKAITLCYGTSTPDTSRKLSIAKKALEDMASHLTKYHLINNLILKSIFPRLWKGGHVSSIPKIDTQQKRAILGCSSS